MRRIMKKGIYATLLSVLLSAGLMVSSALAVDWTAAETTITMPDGEVVAMWGYTDTLPANHPYGPDTPPVIRLTTADTLTINLTNNLPEETSIVIPGQTAAMVPTWTDNATGARTLPTQRVRSFTHEAAATGGAGIYTWSPPLNPGTYLIQSGTHPGVQVQMGLYGVLIVDEAADTAYPGITYNQDVVMLYSEIDIPLHAAVFDGTYGTLAYPTTMARGYTPRYYLINGKPWSPSMSPMAAGTASQDLLLRFLNAGLRDRQPVVQSAFMQLVAEDGNPYGDSRSQYSVNLPPGKTADALIPAAAAGYIPVHDRRLGLTNNNNGPGGMLAFLEVGGLGLNALTVTDPLTVGEITAVSLPGGIQCGNTATDCTESYLTGTEVTLKATGTGDNSLTNWTVEDAGVPTGECTGFGDCVITMDGDKTVTAAFTSYTVVTLVSPDGGERIPGSSGYTIRWGAPATAVSFDLAYSFGASSPWKLIATRVTGNQYVWTIPEVVPNHGDLFVGVIAYDSTDTRIGSDISNAAAIRYANALTAPNGGETWANPVPEDITWNSSLVPGTIATIGLWYQTDPAEPWQLITVLQTDSGSYSWTVPATATTTARVGVIFYDTLGEVLYIDRSDNVFTIN